MNKLRTIFLIILMLVSGIGCNILKHNKKSNNSTNTSSFIVEKENKSLDAISKKVKVIDGQFYVKENAIPAGCIAQLITELNGDNIQALIYLERNSMRGCLNANYKYPNEETIGNMTYTINQKLPNHTYRITVKEAYNKGTLSANTDKIIIQFIEKPYLFKDGTKKMVLSIGKIGDW